MGQESLCTFPPPVSFINTLKASLAPWGACAALFFASLILSIWHLSHGNICPIGIGMGLQEFAEECVKISEESHRNEF